MLPAAFCLLSAVESRGLLLVELKFLDGETK